MTAHQDPILREAAALDERRLPHVLATVVWRRRPTSGQTGARAIVLPDGTVRGFLGGACTGGAVVREALRALRKGTPRLLCLGPEDEFGPAGGARIVEPMSCASEGAMEIFLEPRFPVPRIVTLGEAPLVATFAELAEVLGFEVRRLRLSTEGGLEDVETGEAATLEAPAGGTPSVVLVATMGEYDEDALTLALSSTAPHVALVASKRRAGAVLERLRGRGLGDELDRVQAPAGLDLGPIPHKEIAVAVLAEIVALAAAGRLVLPEGEAPVVRAPDADVQDPVCGMTVRPGGRHHAEHGGKTYHFCCAGCRERFVADPSSFVAEA